jgi:hypothetical protein
MKKQIDIEKLMQWAVNDELPKGNSVDTPIWNVIGNARRSSKFITRSTQECWKCAGSGGFIKKKTCDLCHASGEIPKADWAPTNSGFIDGEAHTDAKVVANALKLLDVTIGLQDEATARALIGPELVALDPNSVLAALAVRPNLLGLVVNRAILKMPPPLDLRLPQPKPIRRSTSKHPVVLRKDADSNTVEVSVQAGWRPKERGNLTGDPWCPIEWCEPMVETIAEQRAEYTLWWHALANLAADLSKLTEHAVYGPTRDAQPWLKKCPFHTYFPATSKYIAANY